MTKTTHLLALVLIFFSGCAPTYIPNLANIPLLENEKELNICGAASTSGTDVQIAYAINNDIAVMMNGTFSSVDTDEDYHKHLFGEMGFGKYWCSDGPFRAEIFGGFGTGTIKTDYDGTTPFMPAYIDASIKRIFVQPNIGLKTSFIDIGLTTRLSFVNIDHKEDELNTGKYELFLEPGIIGKIGYKVLKAYAELGFSIPAYEQEIHYQFLPVYFGIGVQINIKSF